MDLSRSFQAAYLWVALATGDQAHQGSGFGKQEGGLQGNRHLDEPKHCGFLQLIVKESHFVFERDQLLLCIRGITIFSVFSYFRPVIQDVVERYLDCGNPMCGYARIRCPDCGEERLLMLSCKIRGFCPRAMPRGGRSF